ncbi:MAG: hypothetical protein AAF378_05150 [Cyanobacteria bacterium P01_A01_bin.84]
MSEFIEIGSYIIRISDIVLLGFRITSQFEYTIKEGDCVIDVLLSNGVELEIATNCTSRKRFEEVKASLNEHLAFATQPKNEPRRFKTVTTITRKRK